MNTQEFNQAVTEWVLACQEIINAHYRTSYPNLTIPTLEVQEGSRYIRIFRKDGSTSRSAYAFINKGDKDGKGQGDILKPATYKAPAKHARGNLGDANKGLGSMSSYGPAYLR